MHGFRLRLAAHVGFGCTELELDDADLRLFYPCWATDGGDDILVEDHTVDKLSVLDRAADLLDDTNVSKVDV